MKGFTNMHLIVTLYNTMTSEEYQLGLPSNDLDEFFLTFNVYEDWKHDNFLITKIEGDFEFTSYNQDLSLTLLNKLVLTFNNCTPNEQKKILAIAEINDNTFDSLEYSITNHHLYELIPIRYSDKYSLGKHIFYNFVNPRFLAKYEDVLDFELLVDLIYMRCYAFDTSRGVLLKVVDLL